MPGFFRNGCSETDRSETVTERERDSLFARPLGNIGNFVFDSSVARVFPDMIRRSVPGYESIIAMTGMLAGQFATADSTCYDLGCSLGASALAMAAATRDRGSRLVAVDSSPAMLERCREIVRHSDFGARIELRHDDIRRTPIDNAAVAVLNFTLQFVPVAERQALLERIHAGLNAGGILVLSEKVCFTDPKHNELMIELHHNFKRAQGYTDLEISQKRSALEHVLVPETLETHRRRLRGAGFASVDVWFQCFNFASLVAIKDTKFRRSV